MCGFAALAFLSRAAWGVARFARSPPPSVTPAKAGAHRCSGSRLSPGRCEACSLICSFACAWLPVACASGRCSLCSLAPTSVTPAKAGAHRCGGSRLFPRTCEATPNSAAVPRTRRGLARERDQPEESNHSAARRAEFKRIIQAQNNARHPQAQALPHRPARASLALHTPCSISSAGREPCGPRRTLLQGSGVLRRITGRGAHRQGQQEACTWLGGNGSSAFSTFLTSITSMLRMRYELRQRPVTDGVVRNRRQAAGHTRGLARIMWLLPWRFVSGDDGRN